MSKQSGTATDYFAIRHVIIGGCPRLLMRALLLLVGVPIWCGLMLVSAAPSPAAAATPEAAAHVERGRERERSQAFDEAMEEYRAALALDPTASAALFNLARMHALKQHWREAIALYQQVLAQHPDDGEAHYHLAMAYAALNEYPRALVSYDRARALQYTGDPGGLEPMLASYRARTQAIAFDSRQGGQMVVNITGNSLGSPLLLRDVLAHLEILEEASTLRQGIQVEFLAWQGETIQEKWTVQSPAGPHAYLVSFVPAPQGGTDFQISELKEP